MRNIQRVKKPLFCHIFEFIFQLKELLHLYHMKAADLIAKFSQKITNLRKQQPCDISNQPQFETIPNPQQQAQNLQTLQPQAQTPPESNKHPVVSAGQAMQQEQESLMMNQEDNLEEAEKANNNQQNHQDQQDHQQDNEDQPQDQQDYQKNHEQDDIVDIDQRQEGQRLPEISDLEELDIGNVYEKPMASFEENDEPDEFTQEKDRDYGNHFFSDKNDDLNIQNKIQTEPQKWPQQNGYGASNQDNTQRVPQLILTDGRQYDESFRRKFVKKLLRQLAIELPENVEEKIKTSAHGIEVHVYEIKIWITAYKLIFNIERMMQEKGGAISGIERMALIKKELLRYLMKNKNEKKSRILKIISFIFLAFGMPDFKTQAWLNDFTTEFAKDLKGIEFSNKVRFKNNSDSDSSIDKRKGIEQRSQKRQSSFSAQKENSDSSQQGPKIEKKRFNQVQKKFEPVSTSSQPSKPTSNENPFSDPTPENISMYPLSFKQKVASKINEQLMKAMQEILKNKSQEFCLSYNTIKTIYLNNGDYFLRKKSSVQSQPHLQQRQTALNPKIPMNDKGVKTSVVTSNLGNYPRAESKLESTQMTQFAKLEVKLLAFLKSHINCHVSIFEKETETNMDNLGFPEKWKSEVRNNWFCLFLKKNKLAVSSDKRVVRVQPKRPDPPHHPTTIRPSIPSPSPSPSPSPLIQRYPAPIIQTMKPGITNIRPAMKTTQPISKIISDQRRNMMM